MVIVILGGLFLSKIIKKKFGVSKKLKGGGGKGGLGKLEKEVVVFIVDV